MGLSLPIFSRKKWDANVKRCQKFLTPSKPAHADSTG